MTAAMAAACLLIAAGGIYWLKYEDWVVLPRARAIISDKLKDPASTQFRNDRITPAGWLCGELNSKNGNGGYVGFRRFISGGAPGTYAIESEGNLGTESTDEFIVRITAETAIMKNYNEMRAKNPDVEMPPEYKIKEMAAAKVFDDKWKAHCAA